MLSEALLDAEVRIGELTRALPKGQGFASNPENIIHNKRQQCRELEQPAPKPKLEVIKSLGFDKKQVERFETLANNQDIVEKVKAEARENDDLPTRSRVLQLVKEKNQSQKQSEQVVSKKEVNKIVSAIVDTSSLSTDHLVLKSWIDSLSSEEEIGFNLMMLDDAIDKLRTIKAFMTNSKNRRV